MKKSRKIFVAVMLGCSLIIATPLLAQNDTRTSQTAYRDNDDDTGKWGLLGLVGLVGLLAFRKRDENRIRASRNP